MEESPSESNGEGTFLNGDLTERHLAQADESDIGYQIAYPTSLDGAPNTIMMGMAFGGGPQTRGPNCTVGTNQCPKTRLPRNPKEQEEIEELLNWITQYWSEKDFDKICPRLDEIKIMCKP